MTRPLRILSLDGGGIRGVSALLILESIMEKIRDNKGLPHTPLPYEYFDMIGGTSTGGIIAIMLGRLQMSVDECVLAYKKVAERAFKPKAGLQLPARPTGVFSARAFEDAIKQVIVDQCKEETCRERPCQHADKLFRDGACCNTVVLAITKANVDAPPTLFRTYDRSESFKDCTIWQVARATSAATTFFKSIKCGRDDIEFIDAGFGYNNPCDVLLEEAQNIYPGREFGCVLSIGTGLGAVATIKDSRRSILNALTEMASNSRKVADRLDGRFGDNTIYYRFNVQRGLEDITVSDWKQTSSISAHTRNYLQDVRRRIDLCSNALAVATSGTFGGTSRAGASESASLTIVGGEEAGLRDTGNPAVAVPPSAIPTPSHQRKTNAYFEIPFDTNKNYVDRQKLDSQLESFLPTHTHTPPTARRIVLYGLGGSGKTEMAVRFAERHRNDYVAIFWINGSDEARIIESFQMISQVLFLEDAAGSPPQAALARTRTWFSTHSDWLLIIDNLDDDDAVEIIQRKYVNAGMNGDVLITSRNRKSAARWKSIEVSDMEAHEATTLLRNIAGTGMDDEVKLLALSKDLGHLPLALDQAASFILETGISVSRYRELFAAEERRLLEHYPSTQYHQEFRQNVMTTWEISFNCIDRDRPQAAKLLLILSLLHYDDIPGEILESAIQGQRHWAPNGEFEQLPEAEHWVPDDLLTMFSSQVDLLKAIGVLKKFSFLRQQISSTSASFRMHPLVHFWASERLESSPSVLKRQLIICTTGLVAGSFVQHDRLPPLLMRSNRIRGLEERNLDIWPLRQYPHLALHAHRCLQRMGKVDEMPESVAHLTLSLLQVLEYSTFGSLEVDQEVSFSLINHLGKFQTAEKSYLSYSIVLWRLARADLCTCRKTLYIDPVGDGDSWDACAGCSFAYHEAHLLSHNRMAGIFFVSATASTKALHWSLVRRLNSDRYFILKYPLRAPSRSAGGQDSDDDSGTRFVDDSFPYTVLKLASSLERYGLASSQYLVIRSRCEVLENTGREAGRYMEVAETFRNLCGISSEEYRRSVFYATSEMMTAALHGPDNTTDPKNRIVPWLEIETILQPLVDASIKNPVHSWSHERCVVRYADALLKQGKEREARDMMMVVYGAYQSTGRQFRSIQSSRLIPGNASPKDIQVFIRTLTGKTITIRIDTSATVRRLFELIHDKESMPIPSIRLIYAGKPLDPGRFLSDYCIHHEATLHLVLRMLGGV